ncbi:acetyl-CoA synthetase-like protein [Paxillus ammoniavirescens]|nr:acetyl-CoA synthetase-like protein [Paxillus ammoniavirescens]
MSTSILPVPEAPPLDCSLLFSDLINFHMQKNPSFPIFVYANDQAPNGITEITFLEFGRAAHRLAHAFRPARQGNERQLMMFIAQTDTILYHAALAGMSIAGLVPFLVSPRNSAAAVADMMEKTDCSRIITLHRAHHLLVNGICEELAGREPIIIGELPTLAYAFPKLGYEAESDPYGPYPAAASRPDLDRPAMYFHSSGSTGFPKPIPHSYKVQIHWIRQRAIDSLHYLSAPRRLGVMALPAFHAYGLFLAIVPTFLEQWATSKGAVEELKKLENVVYGGGPLPVKIGDALCAAGVVIGSSYGGTEFGNPVLSPNKKDVADGDWLWMRFADNVKIRWAPQGDDTYECQVLTTEDSQMSVENLTDVKGYATSDVFVKHPVKNMWKIVGRIDDVITLASGEKTVPAPMEAAVASSPLVKGAIMFGRERNQVGILIEPQPEYIVDIMDDKAVAEFRNKIWPVIEEANMTAPAFSRIFKEMILIASKSKPILRTHKGTLQKKATVKVYETEIDALYNAVEATCQTPDDSAGPSAWTSKVLEEWLMGHAAVVVSGRSINPDTDLFVQGFDSLSVTKLVYVEADACRDKCGLPSALYDEIRNSVTTIIHNAWRLDFNLSLASFEPNIKATRNLVDLGLDSPHSNSLRFVFASSVGSAQSWDRENGLFPEEVQLDPSPAVGSGYGEGKYVSERIITKSGLHATSLRIGQIAGGPNGSWATTDWVPILIKSSIALGALPDAYGVVSWMRSEEVAASVLDVNVMSSVRDVILEQTSVRSGELSMVPFKDWFSRLEKKSEGASPEDLVDIPAIKLLEFFRSTSFKDEWSRTQTAGNMEVGGISSFSVAKSGLVSKTIAQMRPVGEVEARSWIRYWISKRYL